GRAFACRCVIIVHLRGSLRGCFAASPEEMPICRSMRLGRSVPAPSDPTGARGRADSPLVTRRNASMSGPIYFHIRLRFPTPASIAVWHEHVLLAQREYLEEAPGFGFIDMADDDLLGDEMTVTRVSTLEEALSYLVRVGYHIDDAYRARIIEWGSTV